MITRTRIALVALIVMSLAPLSLLSAQETKTECAEESAAGVPLLSAFHPTIYKLWHVAWPAKNTAMLASLLPDIQQFSDSLVQVQLPKDLRDRQTDWREGVATFQKLVTEYKAAAEPVDTKKLLDAAKKLHAQYERLVQITTPESGEDD